MSIADEITLDRIRATAGALAAHLPVTPVAPLQGPVATALRAEGIDVHMKLEIFQKTGTFKARGALNNCLQLDQGQRARGITAVSAGNHAIAAAFAAQAVGTSAKVVVMPTTHPARLAAVRGYGAEVIVATDGANAFATVDDLVASEGRTFVHPFGSPATVLGTATLGLEFVEQVQDLDAVLIAVGGGGLASGAATAIKLVKPDCLVFGIEPEGADVMRRSFDQGAPARMDKTATIADSLAPPMTVELPFELCRRHLDDLVTVSDDALCRGLALLFRDAKLAVEPAAAAPIAALLGPLRARLRGRRVGLVVCGANIASTVFADYLARGEVLIAAAP